MEIAARVRSTRPPAPALLELKDGEPCVAFPHEESGVAPGQACVFYDNAGPGARVLGGGFIKSAEPVAADAAPHVSRPVARA
jgi:tRNA-specific 2-thiouridylase